MSFQLPLFFYKILESFVFSDVIKFYLFMQKLTG